MRCRAFSRVGLVCLALSLCVATLRASWQADAGTVKVYVKKAAAGAAFSAIPAAVFQRRNARVVDEGAGYVIVQVPAAEASTLRGDLETLAGGVEIRDDFDVVDFRSQPLDARLPPPSIPAGWARNATLPPPSRDAFVVQFASPPRPEWVSQLVSIGSIVGYVSQNAYLVIARSDSLASLASSLPVQLLRPYQPIHRVAPALRASPDAFVDVTVSLADVPESGEAVAYLAQITLEVLQQPENAGDHIFHRVTIPTAVLGRLASLPAVVWVEHYLALQPSGEREAHLAGGGPLSITLNGVLRPAQGNYRQWLIDQGLADYATGMKIGVLDTGFDKGSSTDVHPDFQDGLGNSFVSVVKYSTDSDANDDCYGHGTMVAGVIAGNAGAAFSTTATDDGASNGDSNYLMGLGVVPGTPLVAGRIFDFLGTPNQCDASSLQSWDTIYNDLATRGVKIANNSWSEVPIPGNDASAYDATASSMDQVVRAVSAANATPMAVIFAGGNADDVGGGLSCCKFTVTSPGIAKNVVGVGNSENFNPNTYNTTFQHTSGVDSDNGQDIWTWSRYGPTANDNRIKPDVAAPGTAIESPLTRTAASCCVNRIGAAIDGGAPVGQQHVWSRGTSFSAPVVTGTAALLYRWFTKRSSTAPKPSLLKAMVLTFTRDLTSTGHPPDAKQGWGKSDLAGAFQNDNRYEYANESTLFTASGVSASYPSPTGTYQIKDVQRPVKVTLVWTDRFGTLSSNQALVNNLDLIVHVPSASTKVLGNDFNASTGRSNVYSEGAAGNPDNKNNVEQVVFTSTDVGATTFRIEVNAKQLNGDAINVWPGGTQILRQDFSLFVDNVVGRLGTAAPSGLTASVSGTQVTLNWTGAGGLTKYDIYRRSHASDSFALVTTVNSPTTSYIDTVAANATYGYEIVGRDSSNNTSPASNIDLATTVTFSDGVPAAGVAVKAQHITELRTAAVALRAYMGLPAAVWTDASLVVGQTAVKAVHIAELRARIDEAIGSPATPYTDPTLTAGVTGIRHEHIAELRQRF